MSDALRRCVGRIVGWGALAFSAQGLALYLWADLSPWAAVLWGLFPLMVTASIFSNSHVPFRADLALYTTVAGFGGAGMLLGTFLDGGASAGMHASHAHPSSSGAEPAHLASWSLALMLAACVPSCYWVCHHLTHRLLPKAWSSHLAGALGMLLGMSLGHAWFTTPLEHSLGSATSASHLAMVLGMTMGTAVGLYLWKLVWRVRRLVFLTEGEAPF